MRVTGAEVLERAIQEHPELELPLTTWLEAARAAEWRNPADLRASYPSADGVPIRKRNRVIGVVTVFNIGGNKYRLLSAVNYARQLVTVIDVLTHAEYNKDRWKRRF